MTWLKELVDYGIIGLLISMSIIAMGIALERWQTLKKIKPSNYRHKEEFEITITSKIHLIAIIGANAPYVGLLGTVLGIVLTFYTISQNGMVDSAKIMLGLSLALKATAVGLLVAMPAIFSYNLLIRKIKVLLLQWDIEHGKQSV